MIKEKADVLIIGAGLTGFTIAYLLKDQNLSVRIVEARNRVGGRIYTKKSNNKATIDLGATWIQSPHRHLLSLLKELKVEIFEQKIGSTAIYEQNSFTKGRVNLPPNNAPSYRIKGGTMELINALAKSFDEQHLFFNQAVNSIELHPDHLRVATKTIEFEAKQVISTLPPFLFANSIQLNEPISNKVSTVMSKTHTWMGTSIKVGLVYEKPFWRSEDFTGTIFSNVGPIIEFYDHSNFQESKFALKGFVKDELASLTKEVRLDLILTQLRKYYGNQVDAYLNYEELLWKNETATYLPYLDYVMPHQNNGHEVFQNSYLNNKLFVAGSETAQHFGGYMEGAILSAKFVVAKLARFLSL